jgi:drug/metabolite transporter (DMT)-like permease
LLLSRSDFLRALPVFAVESCLGSYFYLYGITHTPIAVSASLTSLSPVISVPVAAFMGLEKPTLARSLGVVAVVCGVCLLVAG